MHLRLIACSKILLFKVLLESWGQSAEEHCLKISTSPPTQGRLSQRYGYYATCWHRSWRSFVGNGVSISNIGIVALWVAFAVTHSMLITSLNCFVNCASDARRDKLPSRLIASGDRLETELEFYSPNKGQTGWHRFSLTQGLWFLKCRGFYGVPCSKLEKVVNPYCFAPTTAWSIQDKQSLLDRRT